MCFHPISHKTDQESHIKKDHLTHKKGTSRIYIHTWRHTVEDLFLSVHFMLYFGLVFRGISSCFWGIVRCFSEVCDVHSLRWCFWCVWCVGRAVWCRFPQFFTPKSGIGGFLLFHWFYLSGHHSSTINGSLHVNHYLGALEKGLNKAGRYKNGYMKGKYDADWVYRQSTHANQTDKHSLIKRCDISWNTS